VLDVSTSARYDAAVAYIRDRRWATIPLHHVQLDGSCSCRFAATDVDHQAGGKSVGKHPISKGWQSGAAMSLADAFTVWGEDIPQANIGIRTGSASGVFVLDEDPDNGGREAIERMTQANGPLPATYTVRTGSGGRHWYFRLPSAFRVTNGANRLLVQQYGTGLDIRGEGGQVVAAPSVSGKGAYTVLDETDPADAPGWLLELLQATVDTMPVTDSPVIEDLPMTADLDARTAERVQRYAERVLDQEEREYLEAVPGSGNQALFQAACAMIEIAQSPWNTVTVAEVWQRLERARLARKDKHTMGGGQDPQEFSATWESARARVLGQGRALPPDPHQGVTFDPGLFLPAGTASTTAPAPVNRDEAMSLVDQLLARMMSRDDLDTIEPPTPLIEGLLDLESESWVIGQPGGFKSFVALDWAAHVALGLPWRGCEVTQGDVVYVVAEGKKGIPGRVKAWEATYGKRLDSVHFLPEPVQVKGEDTRHTGKPGVEWMTLVGACVRIKPRMIILDTQARITLGLNENDASEAGTLIEAVRLLKEHTGACVLVVHHTGRAGENARGSSAIDGAQDTELRVDRPQAREARQQLTASIKIDKQKDGSEAQGWEIKMRVVEVGTDTRGRTLTSLAIEPLDPYATQASTLQEVDPGQAVRIQDPQDWTWALVDNPKSTVKRQILQALQDLAGEAGRTETQVRRAVAERWYGGKVGRKAGELSTQTWDGHWTAVQGLEVSGEPVMIKPSGERWIINSAALQALQRVVDMS
jgi:bifunctional DNA primase/polymerase-like protein/AAA domain-containing protein